MATAEGADRRRETATRNVEAILDGAQRLLERGERVSIAAVAAEAGVSRVTVYAHFADRERLLEALVERAVRESTAAFDVAEPERGPPPEALERLVAASWTELARHDAIARASAAQLSAEAMRRAHEAARGRIAALVERGRRDGSFRADVPAGWLVTATLALVHAAAEEARTGELGDGDALAALSSSIEALFEPR
jgi:TetR/AcrR family transcriptional repressor of mexCD-oprJ operon